MAITDIQISEELETNAPSIKYRGDEGPKSPQEEQMMMADAILEEEYNKYVFDLLEIRPEATPMTLEEFRQMVIAEGQMSKGPILPSPEDPVNPFGPKPIGPPLPNRQMAAYGGIMGLDGRRKYGIGSSLKKFVRKVIPNEVSKVAVKAAPFVAPFNPLLAGAMAGIGGFDQHGSISKGLKSGLMTYGMGQLGRGIGGGTGNLQTGINPFNSANLPGAGTGTFSKFFSNPLQGEGGLSKFLADRKAPADMSKFNELGLGGSKPSNISLATGDGSAMEAFYQGVAPKPSDVITKTKSGSILKTIKDFALDNKLLTGLAAGTLGATALMGNMEPDEIQDMQRGEGLDIEGIRTEVIEAMKDPSGEALKTIRAK